MPVKVSGQPIGHVCACVHRVILLLCVGLSDTHKKKGVDMSLMYLWTCFVFWDMFVLVVVIFVCFDDNSKHESIL